jgi:hypothetical protein
VLHEAPDDALFAVVKAGLLAEAFFAPVVEQDLLHEALSEAFFALFAQHAPPPDATTAVPEAFDANEALLAPFVLHL